MKTNKVIWHEGLFLQPQHFQQSDRYFEKLFRETFWVLNGNYYGFMRLELDLSLLSLGKVGIQNAAGIFPDFSIFDIPNCDLAPAPIFIPEGLNNTLIYLALPLKGSGVMDAGGNGSKEICRYHVIHEKIKDQVSAPYETAEIALGSLACCFLTEQDDLSGFAVLPVARIKESRANHQITLDKSFVSVWLDVQESGALAKFIPEVHGLLNHRAEMLSDRLTDTQQAGSAEAADLMLLQLSNKYEPIFHYLCHKKPLHPEQLFYVLIQLMGEMAAYTHDKRRPIEAPVYRHEQLFETFKPVIQEVRRALSVVLEQNAVSIVLEERSRGLWVGTLHDKSLIKTAGFVLSVYADVPIEKIRVLFPNQIKIAPVEQIHLLVSKALPGVPIQPVAIAPRQIPYHANFSYFMVNTQHSLWQALEKSGGIALHVSSEMLGLKLELWAVKG